MLYTKYGIAVAIIYSIAIKRNFRLEHLRLVLQHAAFLLFTLPTLPHSIPYSRIGFHLLILTLVLVNITRPVDRQRKVILTLAGQNVFYTLAAEWVAYC